MATNYPTSLDTTTELAEPTATTDLNEAGYEHDTLHVNVNQAVRALEGKVGTGASTSVANTVMAGNGTGTSEWSASPTVSGTMTATTGFVGDLTGDVTGNVSGTAATVTGAAQANITSTGTLTGLTMGGAIAMADNAITTPEFTDYAETVNAIGDTAASQSIDITLGNVHTCTLAVATTTFTFDNPAVTGKGCSFTLIATQDATGTRCITWPASVDWSAATAPTLTTTANRTDIFTFVTYNGGTNWMGFTAGQDFDLT